MWRIHFWAALIASPFTLIAALTGILYIFTPQIESVRYGWLDHVERVGAMRPLDEAVAASPAAPAGWRMQSVMPAYDARDSVKAVFEEQGVSSAGHEGHQHSAAKSQVAPRPSVRAAAQALTVYVNPYTGNVIGSLVNQDRFGNWASDTIRWQSLLRGVVDAQYESYFGKGGVASVAVFGRRIRDVTVQRLFLDGASWVSVPVNDGKAATHGIEFDAKVPLVSLPLGFAHECFAHLVAGRQRECPADYRYSESVTTGVNFNFQNGGLVQLTPALSSYMEVSRTLDLYGLWKLAARTQVRLTVSNALHQPQRSGRYFSTGDVARTVTAPGSTGVRVLIEKNL